MEDELGLIMDVIETKEPREGRELAIKEQDSGSTFNLIFFFPSTFSSFLCTSACARWQILYCCSLEIGERKIHSVII